MSDFVDNLHAVFSAFGTITSRKMFGGHGIYHDGLMFALVADDELYLKADKASAHFFEEQQLPRFEYVKNGKTMTMSYHLAPEEIFDDPDAARDWATRAFDAALRAKK